MKTTRKLVTVFLVICMLSSLVTGCGSDSKNSGATASGGSSTAASNESSNETSQASQSTASPSKAESAGGSLSVTSDMSTDQVDLTSVGTTDWAHWYGYDQKADGGSKISDYTILGTGTVKNYEDDIRQISWSDGTLNASGSSTSGIYIAGRGNGFSIDVPAGTTTSTLKLYVGGWKSSGMLIAHLSDGSAPDFTETTEQASDSFDKLYTLVFNAGSDGQTLNVKWLQSSSGEGNVTLQAAALK